MKIPNFSFEKNIWKKHKFVAGVDEVGRGSFAGPVVAGAVVFPRNLKIDVVINDSKKLTQKRREIADKWIKKNAVSWGIGEAGVGKINKLGIKKATEIAFRAAIKNCGEINYLLIDAFFVPYVADLRRKNQLPIINGDEKSFSIAAASIIAKVYRDRLMTKLAKNSKYKGYKWEKNKGYGTKDHQKAIKKYGATRLHRKLFVRNFVSSQA
jgi:ribonuclease HII